MVKCSACTRASCSSTHPSQALGLCLSSYGPQSLRHVFKCNWNLISISQASPQDLLAPISSRKELVAASDASGRRADPGQLQLQLPPLAAIPRQAPCPHRPCESLPRRGRPSIFVALSRRRAVKASPFWAGHLGTLPEKESLLSPPCPPALVWAWQIQAT